MAVPGIGRHFVALHASDSGALGDAVQHGIGRVVVGHHWRELGKHGVGLDGQVVHRQVGRCQRQRQGQILIELAGRLARQCIHQVEVEGIKGLRSFLDRRNRLGPVVDASKRLEVRVVETLHPHRQPCHAGASECTEAIPLKRSRVGFERDFAIGFQPQPGPYVAQKPVDGRR
jgi:hypothetical protein